MSLKTDPATTKKFLRGSMPFIGFFHTLLGVSVTTIIALRFLPFKYFASLSNLLYDWLVMLWPTSDSIMTPLPLVGFLMTISGPGSPPVWRSSILYPSDSAIAQIS